MGFLGLFGNKNNQQPASPGGAEMQPTPVAPPTVPVAEKTNLENTSTWAQTRNEKTAAVAAPTPTTEIPTSTSIINAAPEGNISQAVDAAASPADEPATPIIETPTTDSPQQTGAPEVIPPTEPASPESPMPTPASTVSGPDTIALDDAATPAAPVVPTTPIEPSEPIAPAPSAPITPPATEVPSTDIITPTPEPTTPPAETHNPIAPSTNESTAPEITIPDLNPVTPSPESPTTPGQPNPIIPPAFTNEALEEKPAAPTQTNDRTITTTETPSVPNSTMTMDQPTNEVTPPTSTEPDA